jgi:predicted Fe-Mo cluster-binding NifX family protein
VFREKTAHNPPRFAGGSFLKVAIPTDDGLRVSRRFGRADRFLVAEVGLGQILDTESRVNPAGSAVPDAADRRPRRRGHRDTHRVVADLLADCRAVIASYLGDSMRRSLSTRGLDVIITSEEFLDRALALFSLVSLRDESRFTTEEELGIEPDEPPSPEPLDGFDA